MKVKEENMKNKESAVFDFLSMIVKSWTWAKLTAEERKRFTSEVNIWEDAGKIKGSYESRYETVHIMYSMFLAALGYQPIGWRETEKQNSLCF